MCHLRLESPERSLVRSREDALGTEAVEEVGHEHRNIVTHDRVAASELEEIYILAHIHKPVKQEAGTERWIEERNIVSEGK